MAPAVSDIDEAASVLPESTDLTPRERHLQRREKTRSWLAIVLGVLLIVQVLTACLGWLFADRDLESMQAFAVVAAPLTTLLGTVLGFYFGSERT